MAAVQTRAARLAIAAIDDFEKGIEDAVSEELTLLNIAKEAGIVKTRKRGENYKWKLVTDRAAVTAMAPEVTSTFVPTNPGIELSLGFRGFKTSDLVHELDIEVADGPVQIFDILQNRIFWMPEHVGRAICTEAYTGDGATDNGFGTNSLIGWNSSIVTTGTYAGQNVATHTALAGQVSAAAPHTTFSTDPFPSLTTAIISCMRGKDAGSGQHYPTHILMDPANFGHVLNAANDLHHRMSYESKLKYGTRTVSHMDVELVMDRFAPPNRNYVINMKTQELQTPFKSLIQTRRKSELSPLSEALLCFFYGRWINKNPRANARITTA